MSLEVFTTQLVQQQIWVDDQQLNMIETLFDWLYLHVFDCERMQTRLDWFESIMPKWLTPGLEHHLQAWGVRRDCDPSYQDLDQDGSDTTPAMPDPINEPVVEPEPVDEPVTEPEQVVEPKPQDTHPKREDRAMPVIPKIPDAPVGPLAKHTKLVAHFDQTYGTDNEFTDMNHESTVTVVNETTNTCRAYITGFNGINMKVDHIDVVVTDDSTGEVSFKDEIGKLEHAYAKDSSHYTYDADCDKLMPMGHTLTMTQYYTNGWLPWERTMEEGWQFTAHHV